MSGAEAVLEQRQIGFSGALDQGLYDALWNRDGPAVAQEERRNPVRTAHRQPAVAPEIEDEEEIPREERCPHGPELAGMADGCKNLG